MAGHLAQDARDAGYVVQPMTRGVPPGQPLGDLLAHEVVVVGPHRPTARAAYASAQIRGS
jgi:hypothetical protein